MTLEYIVPVTLTSAYLNQIKKICEGQKENEDQIVEVYGSMPRSQVGHARSPHLLPDIKPEELRLFIRDLKGINVDFCYTLNNPWQGGKERTEEGKNAILREIETLGDIGVDHFVMSNPYLITLVKEYFSDIHITGSVLIQASSVGEVKNILDLGCESVVLSPDMNRDFPLLKELAHLFGDRITLIVNSSCVRDCPLHTYHALESGLLSMVEIDPNVQYPNGLNDARFCMNYCYSKFQTDPVNFLKMPWIRPEDVWQYEKIGIKKLKIQGRTLGMSEQITLIKAYLARESPSDDLFSIFPGFQDLILREQKNHLDNMRVNKYYLSNKKLDFHGFFKKFVQSEVDCRLGCDRCGHCADIWEKMIENENPNKTIN